MIDTRFAPYGALALRLGLGTMWIAHGLLKVFVFTLPGTVAFFEKVGFWGPLAYVVISLRPPETLFGLFGIYAASAPLYWAWRKIRRKRHHPPAHPPANPGSSTH